MPEKKKGVVPRLRFPEFRNAGPWEVKRLGEVADKITEKVGPRQLVPASISAGIGFVTQINKFGRDISGQQYANYIYLKKGQFAYNKGNSKTFPQGAIYQLREFEEVAVPNVFYTFEFKTGFVAEFFRGYFESNFHGRQLQRFITSSARSDGLLNISADEFFSIVLPTPSDREEQQKIANCLSSLDELIQLQAKKLDALKAHKKGLMQQLFPREGETTPRLRFPEFRNAGPWEVKRLGVVLTFQTGFPFSSKFFNEVGRGVRLVRNTDLKSDERTVFYSGPYDQAYVVNNGDVLVGMDGDFSPSVWRSGPALLNQRVGRIVAKQGNSLSFLHYSLQPALKLIENRTAQTTVKHLSHSAVEQTQWPIPTFPEQQKIADCLASLDELIQLQAQKLEALKAHKKGLMQQLFPQEVG